MKHVASKTNRNEAANVLVTCLSNQMMSWTWHNNNDVVFVQQKRSLFHQEDHLISQIVYLRDNDSFLQERHEAHYATDYKLYKM